MATYTSHYNLTKPEGTERVNIAIINQNMDSIDTQMYKNAQSIIANHGGMAIPSNNNTHAAVSSGQYVYVYNHSSLAEGTYVAKSAISTNGALSLSNLTAVPNGGLNHVYSTLNSNLGITNITIDVSTYAYNTQEGATALFTALPSPFKGVCYASFANGLKAIVTANKTNNNYGSMTYTVDYDVEPYYYGKRNTSIVFDRIAMASNLTPRTTTVTGTTQNNGSLNLSLNNNTNYVVSVKDSEARYRVQAVCTGQGWYAIVTTDDVTPTVVANTEVTLIVRYFPR